MCAYWQSRQDAIKLQNKCNPVNKWILTASKRAEKIPKNHFHCELCNTSLLEPSCESKPHSNAQSLVRIGHHRKICFLRFRFRICFRRMRRLFSTERLFNTLVCNVGNCEDLHRYAVLHIHGVHMRPRAESTTHINRYPL